MDNSNSQTTEPQSTEPPIYPPGHVIMPASAGVDQSAGGTPQPPVNSPQAPTQPLASTMPMAGDQQGQASAPLTSATKPAKSKLPLVLAIIVLILVLVGGGAYAFQLLNHKTVTTTKVETGKSSNGSASVSATAPVTTTVNCGTASCFDANFKSCTPSTLTAASPIANVKYQIFGKKGSGCSMLFEYTSNPNSAWVNQPMTCNYDNTLTLDNSSAAVMDDLLMKKNTYNCTGPLVQILQSQ